MSGLGPSCAAHWETLSLHCPLFPGQPGGSRRNPSQARVSTRLGHGSANRQHTGPVYSSKRSAVSLSLSSLSLSLSLSSLSLSHSPSLLLETVSLLPGSSPPPRRPPDTTRTASGCVAGSCAAQLGKLSWRRISCRRFGCFGLQSNML